MTRMFTLNSRGRKLIYKKNLKLSRYVCIFFVLNFAWNYCVYLFLYKRFKLNIIFSRQLWLGRTCRRVFLKTIVVTHPRTSNKTARLIPVTYGNSCVHSFTPVFFLYILIRIKNRNKIKNRLPKDLK